MKDYCIFHERMKSRMNLSCMTGRELSEKTGITEVSISRYLTGQRVPKATEIIKIANALNCTCDYLLGKNPRKNLSIKEAINILELNRPFEENELQNALDIAIESLKMQIKMEKECSTYDECCKCNICLSDFIIEN